MAVPALSASCEQERSAGLDTPWWRSIRGLRRVKLIGDAAYGGVGPGSPWYAAHVPAGELARSPRDHTAALDRYADRIREFALRCQRGAASVGPFMAPRSRLGIWARNQTLRAMYLMPGKGLMEGRTAGISRSDLPGLNGHRPRSWETTDMNTDQRARQAASFGAIAAVYRRSRPSYPSEAVDWLLPAGGPRVLDLGAGTGKLTEQLAARGLDVVAVEPSEGMREEFAKALPDVPVLAGAGESIPLDDASVDAVLVAQAWHWVDPERAVPEVARVLRPGGWLGLIWNVRDEREPWVRELARILHVDGEHDMHQDDAVAGPPFGPFEHAVFDWTHHVSPDGLVDLVTSRSYVITSTSQERKAMLDKIRDLVRSHPDVAGRTDIALPYRAQCWRAHLP